MRGYLLCYDIADARRLRQMHMLAKAYGRPMQFSVFVCVLRREDRVRLADRVSRLINHRYDRVAILDLGPVPDRESWIPPVEVFGRQSVDPEPGAIIVQFASSAQVLRATCKGARTRPALRNSLV